MWKKLVSLSVVVGISIGCAYAPFGGSSNTLKNAHGVAGLAISKTSAPEKGWWPLSLEYYDFSYSSPDVAIHGVLVKPEGDGPFPGVVVNHGSGASANTFGLEYGWRFAVNGYVAIACDYTHSKAERENTAKVTDTTWKTAENIRRGLAALDVLDSLPYVDGNRLFMYGHSMGAALTTVLSGETDKLKASATTAGGLRGTEEDNDIASKVQCPMLIMHGTADQTVDVSASIRLYEALREQGKPVKIFLFQGEPHQVIHYRTADVFRLMLNFFAENGERAAQTP